MSTATLSTKGQIVIPKEIREALGLEPGAVFDVTYRGQSLVFTVREIVTLADVAGMIPYDGPRLSLEDMEEAIAAGALESMKHC